MHNLVSVWTKRELKLFPYPDQISRWSPAITLRTVLAAILASAFLVTNALYADELSPRLLAELAKEPASSKFREALVQSLHDADIKKGIAWLAQGPDFVWALEAAEQPILVVDDRPAPSMRQVPGTKLWYLFGQVTPLGKLHSFYYLIAGQRFGGRTDLPAFSDYSYAQPSVPQGKLSNKTEFTSKIYDGMTSNYWVYVPSQYDSKTPAALMVFQDGELYITRDSPVTRILDVIDNLIYQKKIPVMICVFISPGDISGAPTGEIYRYVKKYSDQSQRTLKDSMRSVEYDTVSDRYARFLREEVLEEVASKYNIRKDGYSRAIVGQRSGGICAFNVAWQEPDQFNRVISWTGSFAGIQWHPGEVDGGNVYPNKVRTETMRNIRVWLQDGAEDLEAVYGSWPLQNIQLANSLKMREYDFHFSFGHGSHSPAHGSAEFPEELIWLWRGYDPAKTEQVYEMDPVEKSRPYFRVKSLNRDAE
jgi:enterochelin esterase-like enzyme